MEGGYHPRQLLKPRDNPGHDHLGRFHDIRSRHSQHLISILFQKRISPLIAFSLSDAIMRFAVDLDRQPGGGTIKVGNIRAQWMLTPKFRTDFTASQLLP